MYLESLHVSILRDTGLHLCPPVLVPVQGLLEEQLVATPLPSPSDLFLLLFSLRVQARQPLLGDARSQSAQTCTHQLNSPTRLHPTRFLRGGPGPGLGYLLVTVSLPDGLTILLPVPQNPAHLPFKYWREPRIPTHKQTNVVRSTCHFNDFRLVTVTDGESHRTSLCLQLGAPRLSDLE